MRSLAVLPFDIADNERKGGGHIGGLVLYIHVVSRFSHKFYQKRLNGDRRMMHVSKGKSAEISLMSANHSHSWSDSWRRERALQTSQFIL